MNCYLSPNTTKSSLPLLTLGRFTNSLPTLPLVLSSLNHKHMILTRSLHVHKPLFHVYQGLYIIHNLYNSKTETSVDLCMGQQTHFGHIQNFLHMKARDCAPQYYHQVHTHMRTVGSSITHIVICCLYRPATEVSRSFNLQKLERISKTFVNKASHRSLSLSQNLKHPLIFHSTDCPVVQFHFDRLPLNRTKPFHLLLVSTPLSLVMTIACLYLHNNP